MKNGDFCRHQILPPQNQSFECIRFGALIMAISFSLELGFSPPRWGKIKLLEY
jgi:hypothetical protein